MTQGRWDAMGMLFMLLAMLIPGSLATVWGNWAFWLVLPLVGCMITSWMIAERSTV